MNAHFALRSFARIGGQWQTDQWSRLVCRAAWHETHDVKTFLLVPEDGSRIAFEPGQFMTVRAEIGGENVERCYTISSSAAVEGSVAITVKRKEGGRVSTHLHETLGVGGVIEAFGPSGRFGLPEDVEAKFLLISAGSGVTPIASILRTAADLGADLDAVFLTLARTGDDIVFDGEIAPLARRLPKLKVAFAASRPDDRWGGEHGRIDASMLARLVPDLSERTVLCCGPEGFMASVRALVAEAGVPSSRYFEESFDFGTAEDAAALDTTADILPFPDIIPARRVTFAKSGRSFDVAPGQTILQAAKAAGLPMASSCSKGVCGTCKCRKLSGDVTMNHGGGIRQREIDQGMILPCSSRPDSDVVLDR